MTSGLSIEPCPPGTIPDVKVVEARAYEDSRGYFSEVFKQSVFSGEGIELTIRQMSQSYSIHPGTVRGLHFQTPPHSQAKLVRVLHGAVCDVAVDIRAGSPTYGRWVSATLSAENRRQFFVPHGFAHGFFTLKPHTLVVYAVDREYAPDHEAGITVERSRYRDRLARGGFRRYPLRKGQASAAIGRPAPVLFS